MGVIRFIAGFFFLIFFIAAVILGTFKFEFFNKNYIFASLEKGGFYQDFPNAFSASLANDPNLTPQERKDYQKIFSTIPESQIKGIIMRNLSGIFDFLDGKSREIVFSVKKSDLKIVKTDITWSTAKMPSETRKRIELLSGVNSRILSAFIVALIICVGLLVVSGRMALLIAGGITLLIGTAVKMFIGVVTQNTPMKEPAQVLLVLVTKSIFPDIALTWIIAGSAAIGIWFVWGLLQRKAK